MIFFCKVYVDGGEHYNCAVSSGSEFHAARVARKHYEDEGENVLEVEAEMFNTFEHGDYQDYDVL